VLAGGGEEGISEGALVDHVGELDGVGEMEGGLAVGATCRRVLAGYE
jgi:hypothetical protein